MKPIIVVMGVSGCGKSTVGRLLSTELGVPFHDADDFHPSANVEKMKKGLALNDEDRKPWLYQLSELLARESTTGTVLACSALKEKYRTSLSLFVKPTFIYLSLTLDQARTRVSSRKDHFMPAALIHSQFESLEEPQHAIKVDASLDLKKIVQQIIQSLSEAS